MLELNKMLETQTQIMSGFRAVVPLTGAEETMLEDFFLWHDDPDRQQYITVEHLKVVKRRVANLEASVAMMTEHIRRAGGENLI
jgi:hypothetical protein